MFLSIPHPVLFSPFQTDCHSYSLVVPAQYPLTLGNHCLEISRGNTTPMTPESFRHLWAQFCVKAKPERLSPAVYFGEELMKESTLTRHLIVARLSEVFTFTSTLNPSCDSMRYYYTHFAEWGIEC